MVAEHPTVEGIDVAGSLKRLGLDLDTFTRMLVRFAEGQQATVAALRDAVASRDCAAVARHAHALAGASGNLGADAVHAAAKALEGAGRHENVAALAPLFGDLERKVTLVFRSVGTLRGEAATSAPEPGRAPVPTGARPLLELLQAALGDFDLSAATSALAGLEKIAATGGIGDLPRIRKHVDSYEFEEAKTLATRLLEQIGSEVP